MKTNWKRLFLAETVILIVVFSLFLLVSFREIFPPPKQACVPITDGNLEDIKTDILVAMHFGRNDGATYNWVGVSKSFCLDPSKQRIRISDIDDPRLCTKFCGKVMLSCSVIEYVDDLDAATHPTFGGRWGIAISKCLDIPVETVFHSPENPGPCRTRENAVLQDFKMDIPKGNYFLVNNSPEGSDEPHICAYREIS